MGANKNKNQQQTGYGPNAGQSSSGDPKGRSQNQAQYQQQRYESQQGPMAAAMGMNYGRSSEADYGNYTDIMNQYRNIYSGGGQQAGEGGGDGGGGGGGGYSPFTINYNDPFKSYGGYTEFSETGGYSPQDIANMRARGASPVRAAYANAERNVNQQRTLQGGYAPNAIAAQAKMAREQGQGMSDAMVNVEAGLAEARNQGRLAGLGGMSDIESQRLAGDLDVQKYNAQAQQQAQAANNAAGSAAADRAQYANFQNTQDRLAALSGARTMYGTTPGMTDMFGNQLISSVGQGGNFGLGLMGRENEGQQLPGQYEQNMNRFKDIYNTGSTIAAPIVDYFQNRNRPQSQTQQRTANRSLGGG